MHIEFKKLVLHNFMSFGHSELCFEDDGFIRVSGVNNNPDDLATSNGSGKSSLWEGLLWGLTGDTIRGTKQVARLNNDDGTYVGITFLIDGVEYKILRAKDHKQYKTNLRLVIDGQDCSGKGIRESEKLLEERLPDITASLLGSVIVLGQGLPQKFTNNTPSGRKEVLEKLSKSDFMIEDLKTRVATRKKSLSDEKRKYEDEILSLNSKREVLSRQIEGNREQLSKMDRSVLEEALKRTQAEYDLSVGVVEGLEEEYKKICSQQQSAKEKNMSLLAQKQSDELAIKDTYRDRISTLTTDRAEIQAEVSQVKKILIELNSIKDTCPTCGQKLHGVVRPDTSSYEVSLNDLNNKLVVVNDEINALQKELSNELSTISDKYATEISESGALARIHEKESAEMLLSISQEKAESKRKGEMLTKLANDIMQFEVTYNTLLTGINENTKEIEFIDQSVTTAIAYSENMQMHIDVVNKFETSLKRDFRGYLLSSIIEFISKRTKEYCKMIFDTDLIDFSLNGNNIDISYLGKAYENLSGGEKQKIDLIIQFSIRDMLCGYLGFTSNILVLDEVFDGLDMIGCQRVLDVISNLNDIKNIFIVTHRKDLSIPTDKEITVVKSLSGVSELR
jgi:DNA repair exonuclease SbcCD ATPase subunit